MFSIQLYGLLLYLEELIRYNSLNMPISKSAKKALRVSQRKTSLNRHRKEIVKEAVKGASEKNVNHAVSLLDKAAKWGIIHPNKAARLKSRLSKKVGATPKGEKQVATKAAKSAPKKRASAKKKS